MSLVKMHLPPLARSPFPIVTMSRGYQPPYTPPPPTHSPDLPRTQALIQSILQSPRVTLQQAERLGDCLHRLYLIRLTDGRNFILKNPPPYSIRLLRHEQQNLSDEASVLRLISTAPDIPIPQLINYGTIRSPCGPYILRSYLPGTRLSDIALRLSTSERAQIDRTIGYYLRRINSSTAGGFGETGMVFASDGEATWREAFNQLLETALRDAEDMLVSIPYEIIRHHLYCREKLLDLVTVSQLVPMDAGLPDHVLVDERTRQVTGLLGFSKTIWGDPMVASVFASASDAFWEGYGQCPQRTGDERIRYLLYSMYRAVLRITAHYYRPGLDDVELSARRDLTRALNELDKL